MFRRKILLLLAFGVILAIMQSSSYADIIPGRRTEINLMSSVSFSGSGTYAWTSLQLGQYLTKNFELIGSADILITAPTFCDSLLQGNLAFNVNASDKMVVFILGGIGSHTCSDAAVTTPMVNIGGGIRIATRPSIRFEYIAHIKYNRTRFFPADHLHRISIGFSFSI